MQDRKRMTEDFWRGIPSYEVYVSTLVREEVAAASDHIRKEMEKKIKDFHLLEINNEVEELADYYIEKGIFPEKYRSDALHVAVAVVNEIKYILSWNFKHLVKVKTRKMVNLTNEMLGYQSIEIIAPPEL